MPSALELNLYFNNGYFTDAIIKQIYFGNQDIILNEATFDLIKNRTIQYDDVKNTEHYKNITKKIQLTNRKI